MTDDLTKRNYDLILQILQVGGPRWMALRVYKVMY